MTKFVLKPPLKWAGGKRWLVPRLRDLWASHSHRMLVEPFVGGMSVALGLMPRRALLNDANPHLINFYRWLQRGLVVEKDLKNDEGIYYLYRARFNELTELGASDSQESAELFYYLNRTGFNGLCRFNKSGGFNVPVGRYKKINYTYDFRDYAHTIKRWQFTSLDFEDIEPEPDSFVYADPPYDVEFTSYSAGGFSWEDQVRLAYWLVLYPGVVVVSNQATDRILDLYGGLGFDIDLLDAPRRISCNGDRTPAREMLATRGV